MIRETILDASAARLQCARDRGEAWLRESKMESKYAENMQKKREHMERMQMSHSLQVAANQGKMIVSGESASQVLDFYNDAMNQIKYKS